jgi:hypothetical protein
MRPPRPHPALVVTTLLALAACEPHEPASTPPAPSAQPSAVASTPAASALNPARTLDPPPVVNPPIPRDLQALLAAPRRKHCPPHQVAPGVWVRFHCGAFDVVANARKADPAKLRMLKHGRLRLDSPVGSATDTQASVDGGMTEESWRRVLPRMVDHRKVGTEGPVMN